jgi:biotin carboxyl carrier protein
VKYLVTVAGRELEVEIDGDHAIYQGTRYPAALSGVPMTPLRQLTLDGRQTEMAVVPNASGRWTVAFRGERWDAEVLDERTRHIRSLTGSAGAQRGMPPLKAPMPGLVLRVLAAPGQTVAPGEGVVVLEAMKMENELRASAAAVVKQVRVKPGEPVEKGQVLVDFESDHG